MKRILSFGLLLALCFALLAGCTKDNAKPDEDNPGSTGDPALTRTTEYGDALQKTIDKLTAGGVYLQAGEGDTQYLIFNGGNRVYSGITGQMDAKTKTMTVSFHSTDGTGALEVYALTGSDKVDTILLLDNGAQVEFAKLP